VGKDKVKGGGGDQVKVWVGKKDCKRTVPLAHQGGVKKKGAPKGQKGYLGGKNRAGVGKQTKQGFPKRPDPPQKGNGKGIRERQSGVERWKNERKGKKKGHKGTGKGHNGRRRKPLSRKGPRNQRIGRK